MALATDGICAGSAVAGVASTTAGTSAGMNTKPLTDRGACEYERIDEKNLSYSCGRPAVTLWQATEEILLPVCRACKNWIETLESLGIT